MCIGEVKLNILITSLVKSSMLDLMGENGMYKTYGLFSFLWKYRNPPIFLVDFVPNQGLWPNQPVEQIHNGSNIIEDVPKHVGPNLVFADDDQQRSRPGRLAKPTSRLFDPSG